MKTGNHNRLWGLLAATLLTAALLVLGMSGAMAGGGTNTWILDYVDGITDPLLGGDMLEMQDSFVQNYSQFQQACEKDMLHFRWAWQDEKFTSPTYQEWRTVGKDILNFKVPVYENYETLSLHGVVWGEVWDELHNTTYASPEIKVGIQKGYSVKIDLSSSEHITWNDLYEEEAIKYTLVYLDLEGITEGTFWIDLDHNGSKDIVYSVWDPQSDAIFYHAWCEQHSECNRKGQTYTMTVPQSVIDKCKENGKPYVTSFTFKFSGKTSLTGATIEQIETPYTGQKLTPDPKVVVDGITLIRDVDYSITYEANTNVGHHTIHITGIGAYEGTENGNLWILQRDLSKPGTTVSLDKKSYAWTGKAIQPKVTLKAKEGGTLKTTDYTVTFTNNIKVGTATIIITAKGDNCTGSLTKTFKIDKAKNPITVKAKTATLKASDLEKKNQTLKVTQALTVKKAQGKVTYKKVSGDKKITINKSTGKITVKKGLGKGSYKVKVKVSAAGNGNYKTGDKTVIFTLKVK